MNFNDDLEFHQERNELPKQQTPVKKHIPLKLKSNNNLNSVTTTINQNDLTIPSSNQNINILPVENNLDNQIKTNHPISNLNWNINISNTMTQKLVDQIMNYCLICNLPILIYGRLMPCKHVMCIKCANNISLKTCIRDSCQENIERIEKLTKDKIFVCSYDQDTRNVETYRMQPDLSQKKLCGRSYLSQRDLMAHIKHRHDPSVSI